MDEQIPEWFALEHLENQGICHKAEIELMQLEKSNFKNYHGVCHHGAMSSRCKSEVNPSLHALYQAWNDQAVHAVLNQTHQKGKNIYLCHMYYCQISMKKHESVIK